MNIHDFHSSPEMKKFSVAVSVAEGGFESTFQLLLVLFIWLTGGTLHLTTILSSLMMIGKSGAEKLLIFGHENKLRDKSFIAALLNIAEYAPVCAITAIFRLGSVAIIIAYQPHMLQPLNPVFALGLAMIFVHTLSTGIVFLIILWKSWSNGLLKQGAETKLRTLRVEDISYGVTGELSLSTITRWGCLGRKTSRRIQLGIAVFLLLLYTGFLTWILCHLYYNPSNPVIDIWIQSPIKLFIYGVISCGLVSFSLFLYQIFYSVV